MQICLVSYEFPPFIYGGAGTYAGLLYKGLLKKDVDVTVITHGSYSSKNILRIDTPDIRYWRRLFFSHYVNKTIKKIQKKYKFDVIHYNEPHIILSRPNIPTVSSFHSTGVNELLIKMQLLNVISSDNPIETVIKSPIWIFGDILSALYSDRIICPNMHLKYMINKYCFYDKNKISVIPNGIELSYFYDENMDEKILCEYGVEKKKYILFIGRLDPIKGIEYLIKAFIKTKEEFLDIKLLIAGTGPYESYLRKMSNEEDIIFAGHVSDKDTVSILYRNSLMLVIPSLYEALPMVLLEAMSHGVPVIASAVGGIPEVMINGQHGYLVQPKDYIQLSHKMKALLKNEDIRNIIGEYNKSYVQKHYSLNLMTEKMIDIYEQLSLD